MGQKTSFAAGPATLRRNISRGEIDLYADMLAEMQWRPRFCVIVIVDDDGCGVIERARHNCFGMQPGLPGLASDTGG